MFFVLFRTHGDHKHCRRVFQRALKAVTDWPESVCSAYENFEREEGTLDHLYIARMRVAEVREEVRQPLLIAWADVWSCVLKVHSSLSLIL